MRATQKLKTPLHWKQHFDALTPEQSRHRTGAAIEFVLFNIIALPGV
jgi:hypothetical protein